MAKRLFDIFASVCGIVALSSFFLVLSLAIKQEDGGPVFYRGERIGQNGVPFRIFKFRSMVMNAEKIGGSSTADDDPRITKIGHKLRKLKLDEIPQLLNVLKGDMSLVGPRPEVRHYTDMFSEEEKAILRVRPGITDWASLWNPDEGKILAGSPDPEKTYIEKIRPTKLQLQLKYVREKNLRNDLLIIIQTLKAVVLKKSAKSLRE